MTTIYDKIRDSQERLEKGSRKLLFQQLAAVSGTYGGSLTYRSAGSLSSVPNGDQLSPGSKRSDESFPITWIRRRVRMRTIRERTGPPLVYFSAMTEPYMHGCVCVYGVHSNGCVYAHANSTGS